MLGQTALTLTLLLACAAAGAAEDPDRTAKKPAGSTPITGAISEEEFKKLHELRTDKVPPLHGQMLELAGSRAYLSLPEGAKAPLPGVVVIQEWWGLNDNIKHWSDRLAAEGYAALAVDLYEGKVATTPDSAMAYMKTVDEKRALEILLTAHRFLAADPRVRAKRRACLGWCFGGGWSLRLALHAPDVDAAVMYYGHPVMDPEQLATMKAPLLGVFGNKDRSIPPQTVDEFDAALTKAGVRHEILRYDAPHAFANPSNPSYDEKSAAAAWAKVRQFLAANLTPGAAPTPR